MRKFLLAFLLILALTVIITTWGSIGSAVLTLGLLVSGGYLALNRFWQTHDPDDYRFEE